MQSFRDHHGAFLAGTCRRAVHVAMEMGIDKLVLETDSKTVASKLNDNEKVRSIFGPIMEVVKGLLRTRREYRVAWVVRTASCVAHNLAKEGCQNKFCKTWFRLSCAAGFCRGCDEIGYVRKLRIRCNHSN